MASARPAPAEEAGFSLIEVIVAMALLTMVALLSLPFFALSLQQSADTSAHTTATAEVGAALEAVRAAPSCTDPQVAGELPLANATTGPFQDAQGRSFIVVLSVSPTCAHQSVVAVTATAKRSATATTSLASAATQVYVP